MFLSAAPNPLNAGTSGDFNYSEDDSKITIDKYTVKAAEVIIPDKTDGKPVTIIGKKAFSGCPGLTITGYKNSRAEQYAKDNKISFNEKE